MEEIKTANEKRILKFSLSFCWKFPKWDMPYREGNLLIKHFVIVCLQSKTAILCVENLIWSQREPFASLMLRQIWWQICLNLMEALFTANYKISLGIFIRCFALMFKVQTQTQIIIQHWLSLVSLVFYKFKLQKISKNSFLSKKNLRWSEFK